jgi:hypothetical protein
MNTGTNRFLSLNYTQSGNHITASLPSDSVKLIPGFYMLFIMVDDIPSVGKILQIKNAVVNEPKEIGFLDSTFVWTENHNSLGGGQSFKFTIDAKPTGFSGKTYYEVLQTEEEFSENWGNTGDFIRSENNVVYLYHFQTKLNYTTLT